MADVRPFRAFRYELGRVGALSDVVAPPYDVIDAPMQEALYRQSPYNVIRLILNKEEPSDSETENRYTRAARFLREWQADDVLVQDSARALYVYHQEFEVEGRRYTRKGFLARVRLEPFGSGRIYPHEETLAGPRADRLRLFQATAMNLSPVMGLYPDPAGEVTTHLDAAIRRALPLEATDHLGVVNRLWPITDQHVQSLVAGLMGPRPVFIADGHHRYETGLRYLEERRQTGEVRDDEAPANFILMMLIAMSDPGLVIMPTHRLVSALPALSADRLAEILSGHFELQRVGNGPAGTREAWELIEADSSQDMLALGTTDDGVWQLARLRDRAAMEKLAAAHSAAWRGLAVSVLHVLLLEHLLGPALGTKPQCRYVHLVSEVQEAAAKKECRLAVLVPPATMKDLTDIAGGLEKMPPKSTYFYPKLLSGLLFNPLRSS